MQSPELDQLENAQRQVRAAVALGSNLGESRQTIDAAIQTLANHPKIELLSRSSWYRTAPVGPPQPDYINVCIVLAVQLTPQELLHTLLRVEQQFGRVRQERWGARTLDLDLILYNQLIFNTPNLQIPHPRMRERAFVLVPLAEIVPEWIDPVTQKAIAQLVEAVNCSGVTKL